MINTSIGTEQSYRAMPHAIWTSAIPTESVQLFVLKPLFLKPYCLEALLGVINNNVSTISCLTLAPAA
jgi:hypothetical protein